MAKANFNSVDDYIDSQPEAVRDILELVRDTIRKAAPQAGEVISYQMRLARLSIGVWWTSI